MEEAFVPDFSSDYLEGAHPDVLARLVATNAERTPGYGADGHCARAADLIRAACAAPEAQVRFLMGGTQANAVAIDMLLAPWEGVLAAASGHVSIHEAGAIEATGRKVIELPAAAGKVCAVDVEAACRAWADDANREHMVQPGLLYISQPTEYGTLYARAELEALREVCDRFGVRLYVDGARLAYALGAPCNDVGLPDLARLADAFYLGGTKCGALSGEALVLAPGAVEGPLTTLIKRRGALLAKGRLLGVQFEALFEDGLYERIGRQAVTAADRVRAALAGAGLGLHIDSPTNQVFPVLDAGQLAHLSARVNMGFWERLPDGRTVMRLATSWGTDEEQLGALEAALRDGHK